MALASPTRLRIPPESSEGYLWFTPESPTNFNFSVTISCNSSSESFLCSLNGNATLSNIVKESKRAAF